MLSALKKLFVCLLLIMVVVGINGYTEPNRGPDAGSDVRSDAGPDRGSDSGPDRGSSPGPSGVPGKK